MSWSDQPTGEQKTLRAIGDKLSAPPSDSTENLIYLNKSVKFLTGMVDVMQNGVDDANKDILLKIQDAIEDLLIIFGLSDSGDTLNFEWGELATLLKNFTSIFSLQRLISGDWSQLPFNVQLDWIKSIWDNVFGKLSLENLLGLGKDNLIAIGHFDTRSQVPAVPGWTFDPVAGHASAGSAKVTANGTDQFLPLTYIPAKAGDKFPVEGWVMRSSVTGSGQAQIRAQAFAEGSSQIGSDVVVASVAAAGTASWVEISGTFTAPAGTKSVRFGPAIDDQVITGDVRFDDIFTIRPKSFLDISWLTGILSLLQIPELPASKITSGFFPEGMVPGIDALRKSTVSLDTLTGALGRPVGLSVGPGTKVGPNTYVGGATQSDAKNALEEILSKIQNAVTEEIFQDFLDSMATMAAGVPFFGATIAQVISAMEEMRGRIAVDVAGQVIAAMGGIGAAGQDVIQGLTAFVANILAGILGGNGIPAPNQGEVVDAGSGAVDDGAVQIPGGEKFKLSLAGAKAGMVAPAAGDTGQQIWWAVPAGSPDPKFIELGTGQGAFYCTPGPPGQVVYCITELRRNVTWVSGKFQFLPGSGMTPNGTFCLAILQGRGFRGPWGASTIRMPMHFLTTRTNWWYTLWDSTAGGQIVLAQGSYDSPLAYGANQTMTAKIVGNDAIFTLPDGITRRVTDSRIGSFGGPTSFAESYCINSTDDYVTVLDYQCGTDATSAPI